MIEINQEKAAAKGVIHQQSTILVCKVYTPHQAQFSEQGEKARSARILSVQSDLTNDVECAPICAV
jgi:hypothetical protein